MTRREELEARARDYVSLFVYSGAEPAAQKNLTWLFQEVERECWERVTKEAARRQGLILHPGHSLDFDSGWRNAHDAIQVWCRAQQKELG